MYTKQFEAIRKLPLKPTSSHICVRILPQKEKMSESGFVLDTNPDRQDLTAAVVVACGPDCKVTEPGNLVTMSPVATSYSVWHKGEQLGVLKEEQLFGVYDDPEGLLADVDWQEFGKEEAAKKRNGTNYVM